MQAVPGDEGVTLNEASSFSQVQLPGQRCEPAADNTVGGWPWMRVLDHARDLGGTATESTGTATILKDTCWVLGPSMRGWGVRMKVFKRWREISPNFVVLRRQSPARRGSNFPQHLDCFSLFFFYYSHSGEWEVVSHCSFNFNKTNVKHLFMYMLAICNISTQIFYPFFSVGSCHLTEL